MPETLFDPAQTVPHTAADGAGMLDRAALFCRNEASKAYHARQAWESFSLAELTLSILSEAVTRPGWRPKSEAWQSHAALFCPGLFPSLPCLINQTSERNP